MQDKDGMVPAYTGNIRQITVCANGRFVVADEDNPAIKKELPWQVQQQSYLYNNFPATHIQSITDAFSPFGISDLKGLLNVAMEMSRKMNQVNWYGDKVSKPILKNPEDSGVDNIELEDSEGGIIRPTNHVVSQGIDWVALTGIPDGLVSPLNMLKEYFYLVSGDPQLEQNQRQGQEIVAGVDRDWETK